LGLWAASLVGCFNPSLDGEGGYRCQDDPDCPDGYKCRSEGSGRVCKLAGDGGAAVDIGGGPDLRRDGPAVDRRRPDMPRADLAPTKPDLRPDSARPDSVKPDTLKKYCGDGKKNLKEQCDKIDLGGATCASIKLGKTGGKLKCTNKCTYDTTQCYVVTTGHAQKSGFSASVAPDVAWNGTGFQAVWQDLGAGASVNPWGMLLTTAGKLHPGSLLNLTKANGVHETEPAVARRGSGGLVVWTQGTGASANVLGKLVTWSGTTASKTYTFTSQSEAQNAPAVACNSKQECLVVWADDRAKATNLTDIYASHLTAAGGVSTTKNGMIIANTTGAETMPAVASNGTDFLVVWRQVNAGWYSVKARRVTWTGIPTGAKYSMVDTKDIIAAPAVASWGSGYLVAWERKSSISYLSYNIMGSRTDNSGKPFSKDGHGRSFTGAAGDQRNADVACSGTKCLVVWQDARNALFNKADIYGTRVNVLTSTASTLQPYDPDGIKVFTAANDQVSPAVDANGKAFMVVWSGYDPKVASLVKIFSALVTD